MNYHETPSVVLEDLLRRLGSMFDTRCLFPGHDLEDPSVRRHEKKFINAGWRLQAAVLALVLLAASGSGLATPGVMTHGPIIGAMTPTSATFMIRTDKAARVQMGYRDVGSADMQYSASVLTHVESDFTVHIPVSSLFQNTWYEYQVLVDGIEQFHQELPRYQTFTDAAETDFSFAAIADHFRKKDWVPVYDRVRDRTPRFVIQLGDFPHGDSRGLEGSRNQYKNNYRFGKHT